MSERTSASSGLAQAKAQVKQAKAQIQQIEVALKMAEVNLSYTTITSPIDGVVVARSVDKGQTVAASLQAPTLFTIANDLTQMQVIANIDQADIGVINQSNRVSFTVDAFPGQNFNGTINQIRLSPQNVQNVVTYNVVIDVTESRTQTQARHDREPDDNDRRASERAENPQRRAPLPAAKHDAGEDARTAPGRRRSSRRRRDRTG